jgi:signal transduction histidine kinase
MSVPRATILAWSLFGVALILSAISIAIGVREPTGDPVFTILTALVLALPFPALGAFVASRQPRNAVGWILSAIGLFQALNIWSSEWATYALAREPEPLPLGGLAARLAFWSWMPSIGLLVTFLLLLFPSGRLPSPRWRWAAWLAGVGLALTVAGAIWGSASIPATEFLATEGDPSAFPRTALLMAIVGGILVGASALASAASLIVRFRRSRGEERQQIRWMAYAGGFVFVATAIQFLPVAEQQGLGAVLLQGVFLVSILAVPVSMAVAILMHRLYEFDVVIRKTLVFGVLAAFITAVYVAVVVAIGTRTTDSLVPSLVATAVVAALFQPIRRRVTKVADRLVFGRRAEPYEVLARFSDRVGATYAARDVLPRTARVIGEATGADHVEIWLGAGDELRRAAAWPDDADRADAPQTEEEIEHRDEVLGQIRVWTGPGQPLRPAEERLVAALASQTGLVVRNVTLTDELRARVDELSERSRELQESRMRIVQAHDAERRRLERNIHDGAQQHLVALAVKLRLAGATAAKDPERAGVALRELRDQTDLALDTLLDLAGGIYPAELEERGIGPALALQARTSGATVTVDVDGVGRLPIEMEAAVYFVCLEAIQNAAKYARASSVRVRLGQEADTVTFAVEDDGVGFETSRTEGGSGLQNMRDRLAAFGGDVEVRSTPGAGTTVAGRIVVPAEVGA